MSGPDHPPEKSPDERRRAEPDEQDGQVEDGDEVEGLEVDGPETVAEKRLLASFGRQARSVNLARVVRLLGLVELAEAGSLVEEEREEAEHLAHQLVGSAGTFGRRRASDDAALVEDYFLARRGRRGVRVDAGVVLETLRRLRGEFAEEG